ncbi:MAG TPA: hypothetical protein VF147_19280 [Vicinamibacterales bacterium]
MIRKTVPLALVALLTSALPAIADPINITGGSLFYSRGNLAVFSAEGADGWSVRAEFGEQDANYPVSSQCSDDCTPGTVVTLAQSESIVNTGDEFEPSVLGYFRLGGIEYYAKAMSFAINADDFTLPDTVGSAPMLTPSFVFRGTMTGQLPVRGHGARA